MISFDIFIFGGNMNREERIGSLHSKQKYMGISHK